jgi:MFS family permease
MSETVRKTRFPSLVDPSSSKKPWKRWLLAFDCYNATTNIVFTSAIWVIYLAAHGYSPLAIGLFETLFHIAKFLAEVPTGIFADLLGRRKSLIIYCILSAIESLLFLWPSTPFIALSFILSGISIAFRAGANEALLWTLAGAASPEAQVKSYSKLVSRMLMIGLLGEIVGTAAGGYLGNILQVLPFLSKAVVVLLGIPALLLIPEQRATVSELQEKVNPLRHLRSGLLAVSKNPILLGLLLISGLTEGCWQTIYYYYQLYLHGLGFSLSSVGLVVAASMGSNFLFTASAPWFMRRLSEKWLIAIFVSLEIAGLGLMSLAQAILSVIGYLILFQASISVLYPAISTYVNERCPEEQRATVLSFQTGLFSAAMIVLFPLFGLGVSHLAYSTVYMWTLLALVVGSIAIGGTVWILLKLRKRVS